MEGGFGAIQMVEVFDPELHAGMEFVLERRPLEAGLVVPFGPLRQFIAHEEQLFAGHGVHVTEEQAQVGIFLPVVARHHGEERTFAMHDFIVGQRQDEVLMEGVHHAKRQFAVMMLAIHCIRL